LLLFFHTVQVGITHHELAQLLKSYIIVGCNKIYLFVFENITVITRMENWERSNLQVFWSELAPCDHVVQIYDNDKTLLDSLEGFIGSGIIAGDGIIIIATPEHIIALEDRLIKQGFDIDELTASGTYISLTAQETLNSFMKDNWPDPDLFFKLVNNLLKRMQRHGGKVRAFGEMVALLSAQGFIGATMQLESLWNQLHKREEFSLFCAYPKMGFTGDIASYLKPICAAHHKIIDGSPRPSTEIYYKPMITT
jgi:MEDS: MEthanogen/methylotroph, DcmR Sensory domain